VDPKNLFFSKNAFRLLRLDHLCLLALSIYVLIQQIEALNVWHFVIAIAWQDAISYYPAAILYYWRRKPDEPLRMSRWFYVVYNVMHGVPANLAVLLVWYHENGGWEPAMLAIPIHLCIDRGLAGRYLKSFSIAFEPREHELFAEFSRKMAERPIWGASAAAAAPSQDTGAPALRVAQG